MLRSHFNAIQESGIRISVAEVQGATAKHYGMTRDDLLAETRKREVVWPRQIAMYLAKRLTAQSYPQLAERFRKLDHTTITYAVSKVDERLVPNSAVEADMLAILNDLIETKIGQASEIAK